MTTALSSWDTTKAVILAGLFGSILSLCFIEGLGKRQKLTSVAVGIILAHYLTPFIAFLAHEDNYQETIGFLVGLFGMSICAALFRAIQNSDLWAWFMRRFSRPNDGGEV